MKRLIIMLLCLSFSSLALSTNDEAANENHSEHQAVKQADNGNFPKEEKKSIKETPVDKVSEPEPPINPINPF